MGSKDFPKPRSQGVMGNGRITLHLGPRSYIDVCLHGPWTSSHRLSPLQQRGRRCCIISKAPTSCGVKEEELRGVVTNIKY